MRTIKLYNYHHLGDSIFNFILFYNIKDYIEENDIYIKYYCKSEYHDQIKEFNCSKNIEILDSGDPNEYEVGLHLWMGNSTDFKMNWWNTQPKVVDVFFIHFFNEFLEKEKIPIVLDKLEYTDPDLLERYENINKKFDNKYADLDVLIINSTPKSSQYYKDDKEWNPLIYKLNDKYKIVTSEKIEDVNCTCDDKLTVKDIAAISTHAKKIIVVSSGVLPGLLNSYTLNNVEVIYAISYFDVFEQSKFVCKKDINHLYELISNEKENFNSEINYETNYLLCLLLLSVLIFIIYYKKIKNIFLDVFTIKIRKIFNK